jgi:hypothetical protein
MLENVGYKNSKNVILASLLTGVYDVNRNELLKKNDFGIIKKWYDSILKLQLKAIVFHNSFSKDIVEKYTNDYIQFVEVEYDERLKPNVFRYFIYQDYLKQNLKEIQNLFVTDITDVEVVKSPFESNIYIQNADSLFCGDELEILDNDWMRNHCNHLRNLMPDFSTYEALNKYETLLNCGVIGGKITVMKLLFDKMLAVHNAFSYTNTTDYTLDMGVFNFVARTTFPNKICHGEPVNTNFKKYESQRTDCWFRHK